MILPSQPHFQESLILFAVSFALVGGGIEVGLVDCVCVCMSQAARAVGVSFSVHQSSHLHELPLARISKSPGCEVAWLGYGDCFSPSRKDTAKGVTRVREMLFLWNLKSLSPVVSSSVRWWSGGDSAPVEDHGHLGRLVHVASEWSSGSVPQACAMLLAHVAATASATTATLPASVLLAHAAAAAAGLPPQAATAFLPYAATVLFPQAAIGKSC